MGFFEKKINKWLASFLLGSTVAAVTSHTKATHGWWSKITNFLHHGLRELSNELDKEEKGMESIKRSTDSNEKK